MQAKFKRIEKKLDQMRDHLPHIEPGSREEKTVERVAYELKQLSERFRV